MPLPDQHIAPGLERVGPVRPALVGSFELRGGTGEIAAAYERDAPGVVAGGQVRAGASVTACVYACCALAQWTRLTHAI